MRCLALVGMVGISMTGVWTRDRRDVINYIDIVVNRLVRIIWYLSSIGTRQKRSFLSNSRLWILLLLKELRGINDRYGTRAMTCITSGSCMSIICLVCFWIINTWNAGLPSREPVWVRTQVTFRAVRLRNVLGRSVPRWWVRLDCCKTATTVFTSGCVRWRQLNRNHLVFVDDQV